MALHSDAQLALSSAHLIYHVRMYVETFLWLQEHPRPETWDTVRNAVLETHLIHTRVLIHFTQRETSKEETDVLAVDYFHDCPGDFSPLTNDFLLKQAQKVGGQLVHLTTKSSLLKSEQEWQIGEIAKALVPALQGFLSVISIERFPKKNECIRFVNEISSWLNFSSDRFTSVTPTT